jgi:hypothetical protein
MRAWEPKTILLTEVYVEDCYFYTKQIDSKTFVVPMCLECGDKYPNLGWFWEGSQRGYGPFLFKCEKCDKIIYEHKEDLDETK